MARRYEPTPEMLANIIKWYDETHNYNEVCRRTGLSTVIVKRIIDENKDKLKTPINTKGTRLATEIVVKYNGLTPIESKARPDWDTYHSYYSELGILAEKLRDSNGQLQDSF